MKRVKKFIRSRNLNVQPRKVLIVPIMECTSIVTQNLISKEKSSLISMFMNNSERIVSKVSVSLRSQTAMIPRSKVLENISRDLRP